MEQERDDREGDSLTSSHGKGRKQTPGNATSKKANWADDEATTTNHDQSRRDVMGCSVSGDEHVFEVWIVRCDQWQPRNWSDVPPTSVAIEPAEADRFSLEHAACYVKTFNEVKLARPDRLWAVAIPIRIRYEGSPTPQQSVTADMVQRLDEPVRRKDGA